MTNTSEVLAALGDPTRRSVFELVAERPRSVGELAGLLPVTRPAVSQHLRVLGEAGLVSAESRGTRRVYSVRREGLLVLRQWLDVMWRDGLAAFAAAVDSEHETGHDHTGQEAQEDQNE